MRITLQLRFREEPRFLWQNIPAPQSATIPAGTSGQSPARSAREAQGCTPDPSAGRQNSQQHPDASAGNTAPRRSSQAIPRHWSMRLGPLEVRLSAGGPPKPNPVRLLQQAAECSETHARRLLLLGRDDAALAQVVCRYLSRWESSANPITSAEEAKS